MMDKLKNELDSMVNKPTPWVSSLVCVEKKDGSLRLCLEDVYVYVYV